MAGSTLTTMDVEDSAQTYYARLQQIEASASGDGQAWLMPIRKAAMARFAGLGFPTTRDEEWRFTNVSEIANGAFVPAARSRTALCPDVSTSARANDRQSHTRRRSRDTSPGHHDEPE